MEFISMMIREHPYIMAVISFVLAVVTDAIWAKWSRAVAKDYAAPAAHWSALMYLFGIIYTLIIMEKDMLQVFAYVGGAWVGTYFTVKLHVKNKK